jgi:hypothetical protein
LNMDTISLMPCMVNAATHTQESRRTIKTSIIHIARNAPAWRHNQSIWRHHQLDASAAQVHKRYCSPPPLSPMTSGSHPNATQYT